MTFRDIFGGAKNSFIFYNAYIASDAQEIGIRKTMSLITMMSENIGEKQGKMMKKKAIISDFDAKTAYSQLMTIPESLGIRLEVEKESIYSVIFELNNCPFYEAAKILNIDPEPLCRIGMLKFMDKVAKQFNPNLNFELIKFRSSPKDCCKAKIVLK
ncbi:MAG: L-2-amino-thiazoline-4-carboxylic acid hydrolase [Promethearchaeota archaeon]